MAGRSTIEQGKQIRQKILEMIVQYVECHGYPPTYSEIGAAVGLSSKSSVNTHITKMLDSGMLETDVEVPGSPRAIRVPEYKFVKVEENENRTD